MNSVCDRRERDTNDILAVQVARNLSNLAGSPGVVRADIVRSRDSDSRDPEAVACPHDAGRDLAANRYEESTDRHAGGRFSRNARRPSWPSALRSSIGDPIGGLIPEGRIEDEPLRCPDRLGPGRQELAEHIGEAASRSAATSWTSPIRSAVRRRSAHR